ncbi:MAG TPA: molybdenum cofactor biosynthesis protein MoaE [Actinomycetota bacterium]|nr:molybdenum cofactor biosynthesis protein MoaE [Actinomycetota bacterium]
MSEVLVRVTAEAIGIEEVSSFVADPGAGGTCVFVGTVRDRSDAGDVTGLTYEAWEDLAHRRLLELARDVRSRWPLRKVAIVHRLGALTVGDVSVAIAVSAAHRAEAFDACRELIERLKHDVPIWKKEHLTSGDASWVMGS